MSEFKKPVDRETLYDEVWTEPVSVVAPRYGLSDVGLAKICRSLAIPLPSRGYWAKVKAGRVMSRAPLPKLKESAPSNTGLVKLPTEQALIREARRKTQVQVRKEAVPLLSPEEATSAEHPLVRAASKRLRQREGWPENSHLRAAPNEVLNISVSKSAFDRAFKIVDILLKALAKQDFSFEVDTKAGVTHLKWLKTGTAVEFSVSEYIRRTNHEITPAEERARKRYRERNRWDSSLPFPYVPMYDYTPTGILTIQIGRYPSRSWKDTPKTQLEERLGQVVSGVVLFAQETYEREQETARKKEVHRLAVCNYEYLVKRRTDEAQRFKELEAQAVNWERATRLRALASAVEDQAVADGHVSETTSEWLAWARAKADWLDPLIQVSDPILDAPEPKSPGYWY